MNEYVKRWKAYDPFPFDQPSDTENYLSLHQNDYLRLSNHPEVEVVFSDLVLPGELSGLDLAKRVQEVHPNVHVILTSGYSAELMIGWGDGLDLQVLPKPYRQADLARIFRETLQTPLPRAGSGKADEPA